MMRYIIRSMQGLITLFLCTHKNEIKDLVGRKEKQEANECGKSVSSVYNGNFEAM